MRAVRNVTIAIVRALVRELLACVQPGVLAAWRARPSSRPSCARSRWDAFATGARSSYENGPGRRRRADGGGSDAASDAMAPAGGARGAIAAKPTPLGQYRVPVQGGGRSMRAG